MSEPKITIEVDGKLAQYFLGVDRDELLDQVDDADWQEFQAKLRAALSEEGQGEGRAASLRQAVTDLQGVVYGPPGPTPPDLDRALTALARLVDRLGSAPRGIESAGGGPPVQAGGSDAPQPDDAEWAALSAPVVGEAPGLTRDDGERLGGIATQILLDFENPRLPTRRIRDDVDRDVRYLRNLSKAALSAPVEDQARAAVLAEVREVPGALTQIELEALLRRVRMGGTANELDDLREGRRTGLEKLWAALREVRGS